MLLAWHLGRRKDDGRITAEQVSATGVAGHSASRRQDSDQTVHVP